jgi:DUF4097 and DUF4098 domain-containing protein YvlB
MTDHHFDTRGPVQLFCEVGRGTVSVTAHDTTSTHVEVAGTIADQVTVEQDGDRITIVAPRQRTGFFGREPELDVTVALPTGSEAYVKTGSADVSLTGAYAECLVRSGSGDIHAESIGGPSRIETGSGDIGVGQATGELSVKSGSGDIEIREAVGPVAVSTGSGDVRIETAHAGASAKSGSGDLLVEHANGDVALAAASGDMRVGSARRGRVTLKGASGDVLVGVPAGVPVWTDITTLTGEIHSSLAGAGEPAPDSDHLEIRAQTVSGDISLRQL